MAYQIQITRYGKTKPHLNPVTYRPYEFETEIEAQAVANSLMREVLASDWGHILYKVVKVS